MKIEKKHTPFIVAGIIILLVVMYYFLVFKPKKKKEEKLQAEQKAKQESTSSLNELNEEVAITPSISISDEYKLDFSNCPKENFPLKLESCGGRVEQAQTWLLREYGAQFPNWGIDGKWGWEMQEVIQRHLKRDNISETFFFKVGMDKMSIMKW